MCCCHSWRWVCAADGVPLSPYNHHFVCRRFEEALHEANLAFTILFTNLQPTTFPDNSAAALLLPSN
jgi:hypothetical protein